MLPKVKRDDSVGLGLFIYDFLLVFNSNIWPNAAPLWYTMSEFDFDRLRSLDYASHIWFPIISFTFQECKAP